MIKLIRYYIAKRKRKNKLKAYLQWKQTKILPI